MLTKLLTDNNIHHIKMKPFFFSPVEFYPYKIFNYNKIYDYEL